MFQAKVQRQRESITGILIQTKQQGKGLQQKRVSASQAPEQRSPDRNIQEKKAFWLRKDRRNAMIQDRKPSWPEQYSTKKGP